MNINNGEARYVIYPGAVGWFFRRVGTDQCHGPFPTRTDAENRAAVYELQLTVSSVEGLNSPKGNLNG